MLIFFTNLSLEFQVTYLALFCLFLVIDSFKWFWMESLYKNVQLLLEFLKAPFLVLDFSCYTLNDLPDVICNIAIYADNTTFALSVIKHLICGNN